jgi:hypothetical protein
MELDLKPNLMMKVKSNILGKAPTFGPLLFDEDQQIPTILPANQCAAHNKSENIFDECMQITKIFMTNTIANNWREDPKKKNTQMMLGYQNDGDSQEFRTIFLSDKDALEINEAM